jgi:hypothetical protein
MTFSMNRGERAASGWQMWLIPVFAFGLTFLTPALFGSPCGVTSLATYTGSEFQCTLGSFTLEDFTFSSSSTGDATLLSPSQIMVDPTGSTLTTLSVQFSGDFSVTQGQMAEYILAFEVDPVLPKISDPSIDLGPNDPVTLTGEFCGNGTLFSDPNTDPTVLPTCLGDDPSGIFPAKLQIVGSGPAATQTYQFPQLVTTLDSRLILDLDGPASVGTFGTTIGVTGGGPSPVPEPSTSLFLASGLLGFVWLRKRWLANGR